jgi:prepilin-type N-terminal cleavage/methylation domain-containing protein
MHIQNVQKQKGFTLVEIAIVLVIIGLLLGGVLKGQELITNAKIKAVTSDFDNISAAVYAYQDRTGNLPGDVLANVYDGAIADNLMWSQLRTEGFIAGLDTNLVGPSHDLSGIWSALPGNADNMFTKNHICATNIPESFAAGIDSKLDDGNTETGSIRAGTTAAAAIESATSYDTTSEALLVVCKEL